LKSGHRRSIVRLRAGVTPNGTGSSNLKEKSRR
jgi:hypothetical protein